MWTFRYDLIVHKFYQIYLTQLYISCILDYIINACSWLLNWFKNMEQIPVALNFHRKSYDFTI